MSDETMVPILKRTPEMVELHQAKALILHENGASIDAIAAENRTSRSTARRDINTARAIMRPEGSSISLTEKGVLVRPTSHRSRKTKDRDLQYYTKISQVLAPDEHDTDWRMMELDRDTLNKATPTQLVEILVNVSPQFSRALWDFLRLCDAGHKIEVHQKGKKTVDEQGQAALNDFLTDLKTIHGSIKILTGQLFMSAYLRGAMFSELVLDNDKKPVDIVVVDPYTARFQSFNDPVRGLRWKLGQYQDGKFVSLEYPTIRYLTVDKWPGKPYGRSPATPAIFPCLFLLGLAHDLRRVVAQQGYPRIDIALSLEKLAAAYPRIHKKGGDDWEQLIDETLNTIVSTYAQLEPEDAFVHTDDQEVHRPVGALDGQSVQAADALIKSLERMAVQALKTVPLMLGITDGVSEANSNRQWEIEVASVKSCQHLAETMLEGLFSTALEAQGLICDVKVTFHELRTSELQRDELARQVRDQNAAFERDQGWLTELEAAQNAIDRDLDDAVVAELKQRPIKKPVEPPAITNPPGIPNNPQADPDPGQTKGQLVKINDRTYFIPEYEEIIEDVETTQRANPESEPVLELAASV